MTKTRFPFFFHVLHAIERIFVMFSRQPGREIYRAGDFNWVGEFEEHWQSVRAELQRVLEQRDLIPNFQDISPEQLAITDDDKWKTYMLYAYGVKVGRNCQYCPFTTALIERVPAIRTAFFSILSGHKHIPVHRGPYKGLLRAHLALMIPQPNELCRIRIGHTVVHWQEGKMLVFDDTFPHEAWNDSDRERVVLFIDFLRPMYPPLSWLNEFVLRTIVRSPYGRKAIKRFAAWYAERGIEADVKYWNR